MRAFQSTYVGRNDFPKSLPDFLLRQWFTLNARDRRAIRKAFRSRHWIGAALQLGFLGMTGTTLRSLEYVPAAVLRHLGRQFRQLVPDIATLRTLYRRRPTRFAHQRWAIEQWGLREFDPAIEQRLTEHLRSRTNATLSRVWMSVDSVNLIFNRVPNRIPKADVAGIPALRLNCRVRFRTPLSDKAVRKRRLREMVAFGQIGTDNTRESL
jgi:hypothetical protein